MVLVGLAEHSVPSGLLHMFEPVLSAIPDSVYGKELNHSSFLVWPLGNALEMPGLLSISQFFIYKYKAIQWHSLHAKLSEHCRRLPTIV